MLTIKNTSIIGCKILECDRHFDSRGQFQELYQDDNYKKVGIYLEWKQANWSISNKNVLRGIHVANYAKLVTCVSGTIWDFVVDFRRNSDTFLQHIGIELAATEPRQILVPEGCGHGFVSLENDSAVVYLQSDIYANAGEITVKYSDSILNLKYPGENWIISDRDLNAISVNEFVERLD